MSVTPGSWTPQEKHPERVLHVTKIHEEYSVTPSPYFHWKGRLDRCLAAILLIPGIPIIALLVVLVRLTSRGPGIYRQVRMGKDGQHFNMFKIRTMRVNAETETGPVWTQKRDPRVTLLGHVLRKLHLDEFPQLFNVLRGEMSLVGPRPERPEFVCVLAKSVPGYLNRLSVEPGITGLAQINLPPDTDLDSVRRKLSLDMEYIERAHGSLDLRMLFCTLVRLTGIPGELAMRMFGLRRDVHLTADEADSCNGNGAAVSLPTPVSLASRHDEPHQDENVSSRSNGNGNGNGNANGNGNGKMAKRPAHAEKVAPPAL